jgi:hypothetical protein
MRDVQEAARRLGQRLIVVNGGSDESIEAGFAALIQQHVGALLVGSDPFFDIRRGRLIALAAQHRVPAIYQFREYALAGGLMSYGASITDMYRQVGLYVGRVLKARSHPTCRSMQPIKFGLAINLKTAKALGAMVLLVLPSEDHLWIGRHPGQFARLHEDAGMLALGPSCVPAAPQLNREWSLSPEFGWISVNLWDLSKG